MKPQLLSSLSIYSKKDLAKDLFSGLLVAIIALPLSIAIGIQSGVTLVSGIISAIVGGFCIAAFSGSRYSIGGPSATFIGICILYLADPDIGLNGLILITFFAGIVLIAAGFARLGKTLRYVPYPIIVGFSTGIGIILLKGQISDLLGLSASSSSILDIIKSLHTFRLGSILIGTVTLAILYLLPRLTKKVPSIFAAVVVATILSIIFNSFFGDTLSTATIGGVYGKIEADFNFISFAWLNELKLYKLVLPILTVALLSALEGLMSAAVAEGMTSKPHDPDMELVAHGIANSCVGIFCGIPVTGALARTYANINSGAVSPLSGIFHAVVLLIIYLLLMPLMQYIPFAALAAVLIKVSISMSKFPLAIRFLTFGFRDGIALCVTIVLTVLFGVMQGVAAGFCTSIILNITNFSSKLKISEQIVGDSKNKVEHSGSKKMFVLSGSLYFLSINKLVDLIKRELKTVDEVILDMINLSTIDATSVEKLARLTKYTSKQDKMLTVLHLNKRIHDRLITAFDKIVVVWR